MNPISYLFFKSCPIRAQIEITNRCNLDCPMCPRKRLNLKNADMDLDLFYKIINKLSGVREITLSGWGEPLMHPCLDRMIAYCNARHKKIKLTTNGLILNGKTIKNLLGVDEVTFSIDEISYKGNNTLGHYDHRIFSNIKSLATLKKRNKPLIRIQSIYYKENKNDIFKIMHIAKTIGVDTLKLMKINSLYGRDIPDISQQEIMDFYKEASHLAQKLRIRVDLVNYSFFSGIKNILYRIFLYALPHLTGIRCTKVLNFIYITADGKVLPTGCGELYNYVIGDLSKEDLHCIWNKKIFKDFRRNHLSFCNHNCSFLIG